MKSLFLPCSVVLAALLFHYPAAATPIAGADIVTVDGTNWAQVVLFKSLSWDNINAACPGGNCLSGSTLNGWDMEGWVWASASDVADLFNTYIPPDCQVTAPPGVLQFRL